jgi:hypothetical protein
MSGQELDLLKHGRGSQEAHAHTWVLRAATVRERLPLAFNHAGGQAIEDGGFQLFEIRQFQDGSGSELTFLLAIPPVCTTLRSRQTRPEHAGAFPFPIRQWHFSQ